MLQFENDGSVKSLLFSCSVAVKNIERQIYILPREKV